MANALDRLRQVVLSDPDLHRRLVALTDRQELLTTLVVLARQHGVVLDAAQLADEVARARRTWIEQWV